MPLNFWLSMVYEIAPPIELGALFHKPYEVKRLIAFRTCHFRLIMGCRGKVAISARQIKLKRRQYDRDGDHDL